MISRVGQFILLTLLPSGDFAFEAGFDKVHCRECIFILLLLENEQERKESQKDTGEISV